MINLYKTKQVKEQIDACPENVMDIIQRSDYGICITNDRGFYVYVNDKYCQIYSYTREELVGSHFSMVVPDANKDFLQFLHDEFIRTKHEISRSWEVLNRYQKLMQITVDARFSDKIDDKPHKITFVEFVKYV